MRKSSVCLAIGIAFFCGESMAANTVMGDGAKAEKVQSTAVGEGAVAEWGYSTVIGAKASAVESNGTAVGSEAQAKGMSSTAVGAESQAGASATAIGKGVKAMGESAVGIGMGSNAGGGYSIAIKGTTSGSYAVAVGDGAKSSSQSVAIGRESIASGSTAVATGDGATASGHYSIATGPSAKSEGTGSIAVGRYSNASGVDSLANGARSQASGKYATSVGADAKAQVAYGVALGAQSQSTREAGVQGYVPEGATVTEDQKNSGAWKSSMGEASVGYTKEDGTEVTRQVTHVAAGSEDTDAVNVAQLKAVNQRINADFGNSMAQMEDKLNTMQQSFNGRIDTVEKEAQAGIAMAIATAGLPQAYLPGKSMFAMSAGTYRGQTGYALGISHVTDEGHWVIKATGSGNSQGHFGGSLGAGYQW